VNEKKDETHHNAHAADDNVRYAEERILSTEPRRRRQNHSLGAAKHRNRISCKQPYTPASTYQTVY